jgi:hypothetical protein
MRSPALAIGWELWARHRWGLSAVGAGLLTAGVLCRLLPPETTRTAVGASAGLVTLFLYLYLLAVFSYGFGDLNPGAVGGFPPRAFTLPVTTAWLVAWPMLYGTACLALLWLVVDGLILVPCGRGREILWWPAFLLAALVAWFQAVSWALVGPALFRIFLVVLGLPALALTGVYYANKHQITVSEWQACLGLTGLILAAYALAVAGVAADRRGQPWGWPWLRDRLGAVLRRPRPPVSHQDRGSSLPTATLHPFPSPAAAQFWFEWRQHGLFLPGAVTFFQAFLLMWSWLPFEPHEVLRVLIAVVLLPLVLAFFIGFRMGKTGFWARDMNLPPFTATRPLTCTAMALAKFRVAAWSSLLTWAVILVLTPLWVVLSGSGATVSRWLDFLLMKYGAVQVWGLGVLAVAGFISLTWLQLVAGLSLSVTGRAWVVNGVVAVQGAGVAVLTRLGVWTALHPDFYETLLVILWWSGGAVAVLKVLATAAVMRASCRRGLHAGGDLAALWGVWLATVVCLLAPFYLFAPGEAIPVHLIALGVVLSLPLVRLTAVPLALAWNRHR